MSTRTLRPLRDSVIQVDTVCRVKGHNFSWIELGKRTYKTCSQCGYFEHIKQSPIIIETEDDN